jgi:D-glycero-D-manno-heptose 1,7-bisphosphate phosphatase
VITNQSGIGRGKITEQQYQAVNAEFVRQCGGSAVIDAVYYAPDHPNQAGPRRKPGIGMLKEAAQAFALDFSRSWTVGDKPSDVQAGQRAGTRTIHILNRPLSPDSPGEKSADLVVENVGQAIAHILHSSPAFT